MRRLALVTCLSLITLVPWGTRAQVPCQELTNVEVPVCPTCVDGRPAGLCNCWLGQTNSCSDLPPWSSCVKTRTVQPGDAGEIVLKLMVPCYVTYECRPANANLSCHPIFNPCVWTVTGESTERGVLYYPASGECVIN